MRWGTAGRAFGAHRPTRTSFIEADGSCSGPGYTLVAPTMPEHRAESTAEATTGGSTLVPAAAAFRTATSNRHGKWSQAVATGRLAPDCWPVIQARFRIPRTASVFTIGSCFARNIEAELEALGIDVPTRRLGILEGQTGGREGANLLNKFTPPAILQEVKWVRAVRADGGVVTEANTGLLFCRGAGGGIVDLHLHQPQPASLERAFERRQQLYDGAARSLLSCDFVVITLGYVEAWWDAESGLFVDGAPTGVEASERDRFRFTRLGYDECFRQLAEAIALLDEEKPRHFLVTVSPIPLQRTFGGDDVIVANMFSKSILRAVAGELCAGRKNVDYFPSFESAILTRGARVWHEDGLHVTPEFVGALVRRLVEHYVEGVSDSLLDERAADRDFVRLVAAGDFDGARRLRPDPDQFAGPLDRHRARHLLALARLEAHDGHLDAAVGLSGRVATWAQGDDVETVCEAVDLLAEAGAAGEAASARERLRENARATLRRTGTGLSFVRWRTWLERRGRTGEALEVARWHVEEAPRDQTAALQPLILLSRLGLWAEVLEAVPALLSARFDGPLDLTRLASIVARSGRPREALAALDQMMSKADSPELRFHRARVYGRLGRHAEAVSDCREALRSGGDVARVWALLAQSLSCLGEQEEGLAAIRKAVELDPEDGLLRMRLERLVRTSG